MSRILSLRRMLVLLAVALLAACLCFSKYACRSESEKLIADLERGTPPERRAAAEAMGESGDHWSVGPLTKALRDPGPAVRACAARSLAKLAYRRDAWSHIFSWEARDGLEREMMAGGMRSVIEDPVIEGLLVAAGDSHAHVRAAAVEALGKWGDHEILDTLLAALRDDDSGVRSSAALALGDRRRNRPRMPIVPRQRGPDRGLPGQERVVVPIDPEADPTPGFLSRDVQALTEALRDPNDAVRRSAAIALGNIGDTDALPALRAALDDKDKEVREAAGKAVNRLGRALRGDSASHQ